MTCQYPTCIDFELVHEAPWEREDDPPAAPSSQKETPRPRTKTWATDLSPEERREYLRRFCLVHREMGMETWPYGRVSLPVRVTAAITLVIPGKLRLPGLGDWKRWEAWCHMALRGDHSAPDFDTSGLSLRLAAGTESPRSSSGGDDRVPWWQA